jgi:glycerol-3-phosphate dehydrogenase
MKRDLEKMAKTQFDVLFVGGGVTGAAAAYDAAQRGLRVGLVEKRDFGWATSSATSKLIHGGLRYLKNLEFGLVRESLRERRVLTMIAPHLVAPTPFLVPTYRGTSNNFPMIAAGMLLYEMLSFDKAWLEDHARQAPSFRLLTKRGVLAEEPGVDPRKLSGGALYYDCQMLAPERLTLEFVLGAAAHGAQVANYAEVEGLLVEDRRVLGAKVRDAFTGEKREIRAHLVANVAGPWADFVSEMALGGSKKSLIRSQGIHLIFRRVVKDHAVVLRTKGGRHFFLIPWRGMTLAGTTDTRFEGHPDEYGVTKGAAQHFVKEINEAYPSAQLSLDEVCWTYGGLRPIVENETDVDVEVYKASRKYEIYDHANEDKLDGFVTVIGGKYTTSRHLAEQLVDLAERKLGKPRTECRTARMPLPGGDIRRWRDFLIEGGRRYPALGEAMIREVSATYGSRRDRVLTRLSDPALARQLDERWALPAAVVAEAVEEEMAQTLEDILWRRTTLADAGLLTEEAVAGAAEIACARLGWTKRQTAQETKITLDRLERRNLID